MIDGTGDERLIQFVNGGWDDFELRAKDQAIFSYVGQELRLVQNLTIGVYYAIREPQPDPGLNWSVVLIVIVIVITILMIAGVRSY